MSATTEISLVIPHSTSRRSSTAFGVERLLGRVPRVAARTRQPWAGLFNAFGIFPSARSPKECALVLNYKRVLPASARLRVSSSA